MSSVNDKVFWEGVLTIPSTPQKKLKIGNHFVTQQAFNRTKQRVKIYDHDQKGYFLVITEFEKPFSKILIRLRRAKKIETKLGVLYSPEINNLEDISEQSVFDWEDLGEIKDFAKAPEAVLNNWFGKFSFKAEDEDKGIKGLRPPQIGALHAISAHFSVGEKFEPATVVLPTGTGKTETMLAMLVYHRLPKTLVLVPSDSLRTQIANKFMTLGILPDAQVVPQDIARPFVTKLSKGLRSVEEAQKLLDSTNVIVTLPNTLQASDPEALEHLISHCSNLIVDEAHHVSAPQWSSIREKFLDRKITQFTATPFRRDEKRMDGKIIFNYKLGDAQKADYYRPINLLTIEEYGDDKQRDRKIAEKATEALRKDISESYDHLLMARTKTKERAEQVLEIYNEIAPDLKPITIYSGTGRTKANKDAIDKLLNRGNSGSRIVVCVDMLGEGFDLPNLKIAALHDTHKSLAITLQFIGRFTRKGDKESIGEATVVANIADPETEKKLSNLYAEGAEWDVLIKRLSEDQIDKELELQEVITGLKEIGDLHSQLSLWNLRPALSTQIFRTKCESWKPENYRAVLPKDSESWHSLCNQNNILVAVVHRNNTVKWGNYQSLHDSTYDLILAHWNESEQALFLHSTDYKGLRLEKMADEITSKETNLVCGQAIFNILNNVELPLAKNLGSSKMGAISFTSYFGPNVTEGLASVEKAQSELNNIACLGYEDGERVIWGCTQKRGKVWQQTSGSISEWLEWCSKAWNKVDNYDGSESNVTRDFLRPIPLSNPYDSHPIAAMWGEQIQSDLSGRQLIVFEDEEVPICLCEIQVVEDTDSDSLKIKICSEHEETLYQLNISSEKSKGYEYLKLSGPDIFFKKGNSDRIPLEEFVIKDPFFIRYADGTFSYNCYHVPMKLGASEFPRDRVESWNWDNIPLNQESMGKEEKQDTIQYRTFQNITNDYDVIFNDDGKGEAADLVALKGTDSENITLCLIHCKGAKGARVSSDIGNFYTVCGQAQKSVSVKHCGLMSLYFDLKRRHETWEREGKNRFLQGNMRMLSFFKEKARKSNIDFEVIIVQPGGSASTLSSDILKLLGTTELYLKKTSQASFRVITSP